MSFTIRRARFEDAVGIIRAHVRSIREVCAKDYSPEDIAAGKASIVGLYFVPEVVGCGFGKKLVSLMLDEARSDNVSEVYLWSTLTARAFYETLGFRQTPGRDRRISIGGRKIASIPMELKLVDGSPAGLALVRPSVEYRESFLAAMAESGEQDIYIDWGLSQLERDFAGYVNALLRCESAPKPPRVADTIYWAACGEKYAHRASP